MRLHFLVLDLACIRVEARTFRCDRNDLAVLDQLHLARLLEERCNGGGQEHLAFSDADDERALMAGTHEEIGVVVMDHDERKVPLEQAVHGAHGLEEITVVVLLDQVHDHFRIRLRGEAMPFGLERFLELAIVLDDPVQHDRKPAVLTTGQRVRVLLGHGAVRRPAGMTETVIRPGAVRAGGVLQELKIAHGADVLEAAVFAQRETGGVVAAVLEALEAVQQQLLRRTATDISDDPAHPKLLSVAAPCLQRWIEMLQIAVFRKLVLENSKSPA